MQIKIAPSILAADYAHLAEDIQRVEQSGPDFWHIDVMDGHFVPNITIGPQVVKALRPVTNLPFEAHLMISEPLKYADRFVDAGCNIITVHIEALSNSAYKKLAQGLRERGVKAAISLNPATGAEKIKEAAEVSDMVLVMTVHPGFGGQKFMAEVLPKITEIRKFYAGDIAVDGGIDDTTAPLALDAGANVLAVGSYIFKAEDKQKAIERLRKLEMYCRSLKDE